MMKNSNTRGHKSSCTTSQIASNPESQTRWSILILFSSLSIGLLLVLLPHRYVHGNPVPAFVFAAHPSLFHALVIAIMLSFAGASSALLIANNSRHATVGRFYFRISLVSFASAVSILACALLLEIYRLLFSYWGFKFCELNQDCVGLLFQVFRRICPPASEKLSEVS